MGFGHDICAAEPHQDLGTPARDTRLDPARVVGQGASVDLLVEDLSADLEGRAFEIARVAGGWMFRTRAAYNRRFQQMCGHHLVDPVACTPASGWEKGQVENQVGVVRRRFFVPRPKFKSYAELNAWLADRCVAWAKANPHQELRDRTNWEVFQDERASLVPYVGPFDGFHAVPASVSKTCLVRFDKNRYSVDGRAVGRPVEIRAYAERVEFWQDGKIVGQHAVVHWA